MILSEERLRELLTRYPPELQHALAVFQDIQKECGYLPKEHIIDAARYMSMPLSKAYAVATFYRSFSLEPRGRYIIKVCDGTACHIKDSKAVLECLKRLLGVELGGTDADGLFTLEEVACLGCCALAPAMQVGEEYFGKLDDEKIAEVIAAFRAQEGLGDTPPSFAGGGVSARPASWGALTGESTVNSALSMQDARSAAEEVPS